MNFKKSLKPFVAFSAVAAFGLFSAACSDDSSTSTSKEQIPETPADSAVVGLWVDRFEDGDMVSNQEKGWFHYSDISNNGASTIAFPTDAEENNIAVEVDNGSKYAMQVKYTLDKGKYEYDPYVGWGVDVGVDCSRFGGIRYRYKGAAHIARIETSDVTDYDVHMFKVKKSDEWTEITIRFKDMAQEGWGEEVELIPANITAISFQAKGSAKVISDSLLIDDVYLMDTSEVAKDVPDMEIHDPELPKTEIGDIAIKNPLQEKAMKYLNKGVNITNWLEEEGNTFSGKFKIDEKDVKLMAESGLKALRFPIDLDQYATNRDKFVADSTGKIALEFDDKNLFGVLDSFVDWTAKHGMSFIIDYHEYDDSYNITSSKDPKYLTMMAEVWKHVAAHYADSERENLFFELLNEPDMSGGAKVKSAAWHAAAQQILDSIRTVDTTHTIIFGDANYYGIKELVASEPLKDDNVVYAIHTYDPFEFTHQSGSWTEAKTIKNLMFPYDKEKWSEFSSDFGVTKTTASWIKSNIKNYYKRGSKEYIMSVVYPAKEWAVKNNVPVIINEFGALNVKTDKQSVLNYMTAMREISDELEIPLQHWGYTGQFSLFDSDNGVNGTKLVEGMAKAYGLE